MTDTRLFSLLRSVVERAAGFGSLVSHVHMKQNEDGTISTRYSADDSSIHFQSVTKEKIEFEPIRGCFGNLNYLNQLLNSSLMSGINDIQLYTKERNEKTVLLSILFKPNDCMEFTYVATDPFRSSLSLPGKLKINEWPVAFLLERDKIEKIQEFKKIHAAAPSSGSEDIVEICHKNGNISLEFGDKQSHTSNFLLDTEIYSETNKTFSVSVLTDHFIRAIKQAQDENMSTMVEIEEKAINFVGSNNIYDFQITISGRRKE